MVIIQPDDTAVQDIFRQTKEILDSCPVRLAGTSSCKKSAELIAGKLKSHCDSTAIESFEFRPNAFLGFFKVEAVGYLLSMIFFLMGGSWIWLAAIGFTIVNIVALSQFVFYKEHFDPLYKKATGCNVEGRIEPAKDVKQQIIVSGHHDSARVFNFLVKFPRLYAVRIFLGVATNNAAMALAWLWLILAGVTHQTPFFAPLLPYFLFAGSFLAGELFFFLGKKGVPGAGDNLIASVILLKLAEIFGQAKAAGSPLLGHTRLLFVSHDAEESGLRGARAYVEKHKQQLKAMPTYLFNIDSMFDMKEIHFLKTDMNGYQGLSFPMSEQCARLANELGYPASSVPMTFGGGATDAAEYARIGVEATTLLAISMNMIRGGLIYHTPEDKVENLDPEPVEAALRIAYEYVFKKDKEISSE